MNASRVEHRNTRRRLPLLSQAVAIACLLPAVASAQFTLDEEPAKPPADAEDVRELTEVRSRVEVGVGHVSEDSFMFGRYSGLNEEGAYLDLNLDIRKWGPYDGDSTQYSRFQGENLGLDSRFASFEYGRQGDYGVRLEYDQIPYFGDETGRTVFNGVGGGNLVLPSNWVAGENTSGFTQLSQSLKGVDIEHDRKRLGAGFDKLLSPRWHFFTDYNYETKEGLRTTAGIIGNTGGNPRAAILPEPIDYKEHKFDTVLDYTTKRQQVRFGYHLSLFTNEQDTLTWQSPYSRIDGWASGVTYPGAFGRLALPPDNEYHQFALNYGNNLSDTSRFTADVSYARMTQDDTFLDYTINPALAASVTEPLPRRSLDGRIDNMLVNLLYTSRPTPKLNWKAQVRYEDRDNKTPRDTYVYIGGDSQLQDTSPTSSRRRTNEPYSREELKLALDAGYKLAARTDLTAGLEHRSTERTFAEREEADENTARLGLRSQVSSRVSAGLRYARSDRDGSTYVGNEPFVSSYDPRYTATVDGEWENHPDLRKYYLADRERDTLTLFANFLPSHSVSIGFSANYTDDDYDASEFGLTRSTIENYTLDASYMASENTSLYAFATVEDHETDQDGRAFRGGNLKLPQASDPTRDWTVRHRDDMNSLGVGFTHALIEDRLDIGADYVYAKSDGKIDVTTGSSLESEPLPDLRTNLHALSLYGGYKLKTDVFLKVRYHYEQYDSDDWALDDVESDTLANVLTLGDTSPDYDVHVVTLSLEYRF